MTDDLVWVVGAGGLLGSAVVSSLRVAGHQRVVTMSVPWTHETDSIAVLTQGIDAMIEQADGGPWKIMWCAGAGVTSTPQPVLDAEIRVHDAFFTALTDRISRGLSRNGAVFLASSAGALYAGSDDPPFDERTIPRPLAAYGEAKLITEERVRRFSDETSVPSLIGRISNLYGPGQNLAKPQGIISHLCRCDLTAQPISIYVSLDTLRDYMFVTDCAATVIDGLDALVAAGSTTSTAKIIASQQDTTIAAVLGECRRVFRHPPRVVLGTSSYASAQAHDLRLRSVIMPELDRRALTPLPVGVASTSRDLRRAIQLGAAG